MRPGELTFDTQGNLVSPTQKVNYKGDFAADAAAGTNALSIDLDLISMDQLNLHLILMLELLPKTDKQLVS